MRGFFEFKGQMWRTAFDPITQNFVSVKVPVPTLNLCPRDILDSIKHETECKAVNATKRQSLSQERR